MIEIKHKETGEVLYRVKSSAPAKADELPGDKWHGSILTRIDLRGVNLRGAELSFSNLFGADLAGADLSEAEIGVCNLRVANLQGANLSSASLVDADLFHTNLRKTDLRGATLYKTILRNVNLSSANLRMAMMGSTIFADCQNLHEAVGLDEVDHRGSSSLDAATLRACIHGLPDVFLEGVGYTRHEIEYLRSLYTSAAIQFYSCFISHAVTKVDGAFADRLRNDLLAKNISCWHFRYDMKMGDRWATQIDSAIKQHDKLVVVCSKKGILREGVIKEVIRAIEQETNTGVQKLFPVRLDDFIFSPEMTEAFNALAPHLRRADWLDYLREYQIGDFRKWKDHDAYQEQFTKLLDALKNPAKR